MIKIQLDTVAKKLSGIVYKDEAGNDLTYGKILGFALENSKPEGVDSRKALGWATALCQEGGVTLDQSDYDKLYTFVESNFVPGVGGKIQEFMKAAKEAV